MVELDSRHKAEKKTMRKMLKDELREFNEEWDMKLGQLKA